MNAPSQTRYGSLWGFRPLKLTPVKAGRVIKLLEETGFSCVRQKGSHIIMNHPDGRTIVIPDHQGEELGRGILRSIIRQAGLTREEFIQMLSK
ncbi:type II toxin-antitoxin system HicA family toxin [Methanocalculus sp.]|uniref:type II toxin-antitoxin system HicA family toxin n=1 Tax=Methanocalculus sp. TaxID=2004547 RepID=UPI0026302CD3|nr:type II toxin-antitoxin system HicA family toxin [Methanocalculus sp.]MDG6250175.1 type II toxin-antitoxin system HicA family toxin [Methanocalculus sp.]